MAFTGGMRWQGPRKCADNKVEEWHIGYMNRRPFPIDMAGFAINTKELSKYPDVSFRTDLKAWMQESSILLEFGLKRNSLEAKRCGEILVWNTKTMLPDLSTEKNRKKSATFVDEEIEV